MSPPPPQETQPQSAQRMYNLRAPTYEDSWHPSYSHRFAAHAPLHPGARVLSLCCGTGLDALQAADRGCLVTAIDISDGMLAQIRPHPNLVRVLQGDVTQLHLLLDVDDADERASFDVILCSNAFVLLQHPEQVLAHWKTYLKSGGKLVVDITHEHNLRAGTVLETVARRDLGHADFPSNRLWIESRDSFARLLEAQGLVVDKVVLMDELTGRGTRWIGVEEADEVFEGIVATPLTEKIASDDFRSKAKPLFRKRWAEAAVDGKVEDVDALWLYVATKPDEEEKSLKSSVPSNDNDSRNM